jgi:phage FluMu protein Com
MFGRNKKSDSAATETVSEFFDRKTEQLKQRKRILMSRIDHIVRGQHKHYFSKQDLLTKNHNARCKVCGMLLSEFRVQRKMENWSPHLKPVNRQVPKNDKPDDE